MAFQVQRLSRVLRIFGVMVGPGRCYQRDRAADATKTNSNNVVQFVEHDGARDDDAATTENTFDRSSKYKRGAAHAGPSSHPFRADAEVDTTEDLRALFSSSSTSSTPTHTDTTTTSFSSSSATLIPAPEPVSAPDSQMLRRGAGGSRPRNSGRSTTKPETPSRKTKRGTQVERNPHQPLSSAPARLLAEHASSNPNLCLHWADDYECSPTQCRKDAKTCRTFHPYYVNGKQSGGVWSNANCNAAHCCQEGGACSSFTCPGPEWTDGSNSASPSCCNGASCTNEECCDKVTTSTTTPGTTATSTTTAGSDSAAADASLNSGTTATSTTTAGSDSAAADDSLTSTWWLLAMVGIASALLT